MIWTAADTENPYRILTNSENISGLMEVEGKTHIYMNGDDSPFIVNEMPAMMFTAEQLAFMIELDCTEGEKLYIRPQNFAAASNDGEGDSLVYLLGIDAGFGVVQSLEDIQEQFLEKGK